MTVFKLIKWMLQLVAVAIIIIPILGTIGVTYSHVNPSLAKVALLSR